MLYYAMAMGFLSDMGIKRSSKAASAHIYGDRDHAHTQYIERMVPSVVCVCVCVQIQPLANLVRQYLFTLAVVFRS